MSIIFYNKEDIIRLHLDGFSSYELAKIYKVKDNSMRKFLIHHKVLRKNSGYKIEQDMDKWFKKNNINAIHQKGDERFDFLLDDGTRIDVKSATKFKDQYRFELQHLKAKKRKTSKDLDELYLIFKSEPNFPIYKIDFKEVEYLKQNLAIKLNYKKSKHKLIHIGYLY